MGNILTEKKIVVMGVANKRSIAWGCAQMMAEQGAQIIYTYQNFRMKKSLQRLVDDENQLIECDVADDESIEQAFTTIKERFTKVDGIVHAIAFAKKEELAGSILVLVAKVMQSRKMFRLIPLLLSLRLLIS